MPLETSSNNSLIKSEPFLDANLTIENLFLRDYIKHPTTILECLNPDTNG